MTNETNPRRALLQAICNVSAAVGKIAKGDTNEHGKYKFASIDAFLEEIGPAMAQQGLVSVIDQLEADVVERTNQYNKTTAYERSKWECQLHHIDGGVYGPVVRVLELPLTGAQTNGAAQSYVQKVFYRQVFNIPTGEPDADSIEPQERQIVRRDTTPARQQPPQQSRADSRALFSQLQEALRNTPSLDELSDLWNAHKAEINANAFKTDIIQMFTDRKAELTPEGNDQ